MVSLPEALTGAAAGRRKLPREVMHEHQRRSVIEPAIEVFAKRGYPATTVDHLVDASPTSVGTFYALFEGKEGCMLAAYDSVVAEARERIAAAVPSGRPWPERVCAAVRELLAFVADRPLAARLAVVEIQTAGSRALERYAQTVDEAVALLREGRSLGPEAATLPRTLEEANVSGIAWLLHQQLVTGGAAEAAALYPEVVEVLLSPYLGEPGARRLAEATAAPPA